MCGRMWQTMNLRLLMREAQARFARNSGSYTGGTFNMGPTNVIPAIRRYNRLMDNVEKIGEEEEVQDQDQEQNQNEEIKNNSNDNQEQQNEDSNSDKNEQQNKGQLIDDVGRMEEMKEGDRVLDFLKWGHDTKHGLIINVRSEDASVKPTFKPFINQNRCVVMAQGYYEWDSKKNPHSFKNKDNQTILIAALYTNEDKVMVLTREAKGHLGKVHQRMPVILNEDEVEKWLDCENNSFADVTKDILSRWSFIENITIQQLGPSVNNIREKSEKCLMSIEDYKKELDKTGIKRFFQPVQKKSVSEQDKQQENSQQQKQQSDEPIKLQQKFPQ